MGLFGGGNSTSNTTNLTQTENSDQRQVGDGSATVINAGGGTVSVIDQGSVAKALDNSRAVFDVANKSLADVIGLSRDTAEETRQAFSLLSSSNSDAFERLTQSQQNAFDRIANAQASGLTALTQASTSTLDKFISLASDIAATGANSVNQQAKSLAESFATVGGKSPDALRNLGILAVIAFAIWKFAR